MDSRKTKPDGLILVFPDCYKDERGWFMETYSQPKYEEIGITCDFIQDNQSFSKNKGILRGLHFQINPMAQNKLVRCTRGEVLDVGVDLRKASPTYTEWCAVKLTEENKIQFFIPAGFAHGFITLTDDVEIQYKVDNVYSKDHDRSVSYRDPVFAIDWAAISGLCAPGEKFEPIVSDKDRNAPLLADSDANF